VGIAKGVTVNMGNYQSARIDCWIIGECEDDDTAKMNKFVENSGLIDEQIEFENDQLENIVKEYREK
jgi:hypothetical protein